MGVERHRLRPRHLYALLFANKRCYIGQTVTAKRRWAEHRRVWPDPFVPVVLETVTSTRLEAEEFEYAWRLAAHRRGWRVYAEPGVVVDPSRRATPYRWRLSRRCAWPPPFTEVLPKSQRTVWPALVAAVLLAAVLWWGVVAGPLSRWFAFASSWLGRGG